MPSPTTQQRIDQRTQIAHDRMLFNWPGGKIAKFFGLHTANAADRATDWAYKPKVTFLGSTMKGILRGACYALVITAVAVAAAYPVGLVAAIGLTGNQLLGLTALGLSTGFGIYEGQKALDNRLYNTTPRAGDFIAQKTGAVPKNRTPVKTPAETLADEGHPGFAARIRRERAVAAEQEPTHYR